MTDKLEQVMHWAGQARHMLLATVDQTETPHLTPVEECRHAGGDRIAVQAWIDIPDLRRREGRSRLALLLWDKDGNGYQLKGQMVRSQETAVLDGLAEVEERVHFPQVERTLLMRVDGIEEFHFGRTEPSHAHR